MPDAMMRIPGGEALTADDPAEVPRMTDPKPPGERWDEAMDLKAAGRVLEALDEPEPPSQPRDAERGTLPSIEGYVLDGRLGRGGGGEVYRAVRIGSDHPLAIKILNQRIGETPEARRAWRELDVLEQLRLPCLPRLIDHGITDGRMFLVMEFIDGHSLTEHCRTNDLDRPARVELLAKVADAVQSLHERGVMHRDIKPSNVIIDSNGQPVLIDLGIAALLSRSAAETLTKDGAPIGSPAYMAPEQARGEKEAISTRSDVYGLGATAYVILTGHTPHDMDATLHEAIRRVAFDEPRLPREIEPTLPKPLAAVLAKAAAQDPHRRYTSPAEFARDLRRWLNREPVEAGGISLPQRVGRLVARHPIMTTAAACVCIALSVLLATVGTIWYSHSRPYKVWLSDDMKEVRLVALNGRILRSWSTRNERGCIDGQLVDVPSETEDEKEKLVLIAFNQSAGDDLAGTLCAFRASSRMDPPVWKRRVELADIPVSLHARGAKEEQFGAICVTIADVFAQIPGEEIICEFLHTPSSWAVIRIYSLSGDLLYQIWHDGGPNDRQWDPHSSLLVFCGSHCSAHWDERGQSTTKPAYPYVVYAVRPRLGHLGTDWATTEDGASDPTLAWYRCIVPPSASNVFRLPTLSSPRPGSPASCVVELSLEGHQDARFGIAFDLDETGREVAGTRVLSDEYKVDQSSLDSSLIRLGELPPIVDDHE